MDNCFLNSPGDEVQTIEGVFQEENVEQREPEDVHVAFDLVVVGAKVLLSVGFEKQWGQINAILAIENLLKSRVATREHVGLRELDVPLGIEVDIQGTEVTMCVALFFEIRTAIHDLLNQEPNVRFLKVLRGVSTDLELFFQGVKVAVGNDDDLASVGAEFVVEVGAYG